MLDASCLLALSTAQVFTKANLKSIEQVRIFPKVKKIAYACAYSCIAHEVMIRMSTAISRSKSSACDRSVLFYAKPVLDTVCSLKQAKGDDARVLPTQYHSWTGCPKKGKEMFMSHAPRSHRNSGPLLWALHTLRVPATCCTQYAGHMRSRLSIRATQPACCIRCARIRYLQQLLHDMQVPCAMAHNYCVPQNVV